MKLIHDLLFLDTTLSGPDPEKDSLLFISALKLGKDNLLQTGFYASAIKTSGLERTLQEQSVLSGIPYETLKNAPRHLEVIKTFANTFTGQYIIVVHGFKTIKTIEVAFKKHSIPFNYNIPIIDLWTLGAAYLLTRGIRKLPTITTLLENFNLTLKNPKDSADRVRVMSELFKKLINA